jgi:MATE family multidrug resistance protein
MTATLRDGLLVALAMAIGMLLMREQILAFGLSLLGGSAAASANAAQFYSIKIWGAPGVLATMVFVGWLIGVQNARAAMLLAAIPCLLHAALDIVFVVILELGIAGAASAALVTAYVSAALGAWLVSRELLRYKAVRARPWDWVQLRRLLSLNSNILLRTLSLIATFAFFTHQSARQGDTVLAANAILLNFQMLTALALDGFANALEALVGAAIGAMDRARFIASVILGGAWSLLFALLFVCFYLVSGSFLIQLLTDIMPVRAAAGQYMFWAVISPVISVWCFVLDGIFIGATKGREMRNSMLVATFGVFLPSWTVLQHYGNHGLWLAFMLFFAARGFVMGWYGIKLDRRGEFA